MTKELDKYTRKIENYLKLKKPPKNIDDIPEVSEFEVDQTPSKQNVFEQLNLKQIQLSSMKKKNQDLIDKIDDIKNDKYSLNQQMQVLNEAKQKNNEENLKIINEFK